MSGKIECYRGQVVWYRSLEAPTSRPPFSTPFSSLLPQASITLTDYTQDSLLRLALHGSFPQNDSDWYYLYPKAQNIEGSLLPLCLDREPSTPFVVNDIWSIFGTEVFESMFENCRKNFQCWKSDHRVSSCDDLYFQYYAWSLAQDLVKTINSANKGRGVVASAISTYQLTLTSKPSSPSPQPQQTSTSKISHP